MNKAERWKAVEELFYRALEIPEDERSAFIEVKLPRRRGYVPRSAIPHRKRYARPPMDLWPPPP